MTKIVVHIPSYNNEMANILTALYDGGGQYAIYDYVNENYPLWDWRFCEPCDDETPVWNDSKVKVCAVCFSYYDEVD